MKADRKWVAIDPGERHCGVVSSESGPITFEPPLLFAFLELWLPKEPRALIIMEEFRLYPWKAQEQGFSQLKTVETIGVVRYICAENGNDLVEQSATIKKPTFMIMKARDVPLRGRNQHERDAEAHAYYYWRDKR